MSNTTSPSPDPPGAAGRHRRHRSEIEPLLQLVHPRLEHGDGAGSPGSGVFSPASSTRGWDSGFGGRGGGSSEDVADATAALLGGRGPAQRAVDERQIRGGWFVWVLTVSACVSGLLFGYDTGVISATLVSISTSLSHRALTSIDKSLITSSTALLGLVASPLSSILADRHGRKPVILLADVLFVLGALCQAVSATVGQMVLGRAVVGAAVGMSSFVTPLYISELAPARIRGRLVTLNVLCITLGQVVAYLVGWRFAEYWDQPGGDGGAGGDNGHGGWRWMVGLGAVPALVQGLVLLSWMPETPRWLVKAEKVGEAEEVIRKTLGVAKPDRDESGYDTGVENEDDEARASLLAIQAEVRAEEEERAKVARRRQDNGSGDMQVDDAGFLAGWNELLDIPRNRRALTIACLLQGLQQLCGFNSLMYFSATIFELLGFKVPTLTSLTVAATNFVFTILALLFIDRIGRRRILLYSVPFMVAGLLLAAIGFRYVHLSPPPSSTPADSTATASQRSPAAPLVILTSMMLFTASYALGLGNVPWMQSELFPLSVRSLGSGLATSTNWLANFVVGLTFLPLMELLSPSWTFVVYAVVCAAGWLAIWHVYPETAGLTLEEAAGLLDQGWGVR
ncbi:general substrate transporter [Microdochium trichocladiopsis]|uniref:General substrate transporter n=1 Tax=Microdochium trichocladiopsis TaxID=1682393 RepID=A0A9P8YJE7_9PEZI|nr:general substrate transporter [Microdochium trichocladiopsis]KAH7040135.1 general substrate transporter [Microdochium trichocladiopsis]